MNTEFGTHFVLNVSCFSFASSRSHFVVLETFLPLSLGAITNVYIYTFCLFVCFLVCLTKKCFFFCVCPCVIVAAAVLGGVDNIWIKPGSKVLYIGAAAGTSVSHVSDIVGKDGAV